MTIKIRTLLLQRADMSEIVHYMVFMQKLHFLYFCISMLLLKFPSPFRSVSALIMSVTDISSFCCFIFGRRSNYHWL